MRKKNPFHNRKMLLMSIVLIFLVLFGLFSYKRYTSYCMKQNQTDVENTISSLTFSQTDRAEEINSLQNLLENSQYLSEAQQGALAQQLSNLYLMSGDEEMFNTYAGHAISCFSQENDYEEAGYVYLTLAHHFYDCYAFNEASILLDKLEQSKPITDYKNRKYQILYYIMRANLSSAKQFHTMALSYIEDAKAVLKDCHDETFYAQYKGMIMVAESKLYLNKGDFKKAENLLPTMDVAQLYESADRSQLLDAWYRIPYTEIYTRIAAVEGYENYLLTSTDKYCTYCQKYGYNRLEIELLRELLPYISDRYADVREHYNQQLDELTNNLLDDMNSKHASLLANRLNDSIALADTQKRHQQQTFRTIRFFLLCTVIFNLVLQIFLCIIKETMTDSLTSLQNRKSLALHLKHLKTKPYAVIMIDIDNFKTVNDSYGHPFGDIVLHELGQIILSECRHKISGFRYGGEEFCVVIKTSSSYLALEIAETLREKLSATAWEHDALKCTISLGIGFRSQDEEPLQLADRNLYYSKQHGKNAISYLKKDTIICLRKGREVCHDKIGDFAMYP